MFKIRKKIILISIVVSFAVMLIISAGYILADWQGGTAVNQIETSGRQDLVAYWKFDSNDVSGTTVYDKSGRGNTAVSNNAPSLVSGQREQAMMFNGTTDYLTVAQVSDFAWGTSKNFTIVLWFFSTTTPYTALANMVDADNGTPRWELGVTSANNLYAQTHDGTRQATPQIANPSDG